MAESIEETSYQKDCSHGSFKDELLRTPPVQTIFEKKLFTMKVFTTDTGVVVESKSINTIGNFLGGNFILHIQVEMVRRKLRLGAASWRASNLKYVLYNSCMNEGKVV